jgi:hypothetical protein
MAQELEVLVLHVLGFMRGNASVGEEPLCVAGPPPIEAQLHGSWRQGGEEPGLEVHLEPEKQVESTFPDSPGELGESSPSSHAPVPTEDDEVVDRGVVVDQKVGHGLNDPGDSRLRPGSLECVGHRQDVDRISDG